MKKNVKIKIAKHAGFCFGVRRAVEIVEKELESGKNIFCLGDLVHNNRVVNDLKKKGLKVCNSIDKIPPNNFLIIRSHGLDKRSIKKAKESKLKIIDATCPFVKKLQETIENFYKNKLQVIIIGNYSHPEILAARSYADNKALIVKDEKEAKKLGNFSKCGIAIQTTKSIELLKKVAIEMLSHSKDIHISNTVCLDSFFKKEEVKKMVKNMDVVVAIGGKKSNNTNELVKISKGTRAKTFKIEDSSELNSKWFNKAKNIAIIAGSSTPKISIDETIIKIREMF